MLHTFTQFLTEISGRELRELKEMGLVPRLYWVNLSIEEYGFSQNDIKEIERTYDIRFKKRGHQYRVSGLKPQMEEFIENYLAHVLWDNLGRIEWAKLSDGDYTLVH